MRLKPSLFQLIVVLMTSSLVVSCNPQQNETLVDCNDPAAQQSKNCNSSSGRSTSGSVYRGYGNTTRQGDLEGGNQGKSSRSGDSHSSSKAGRGGFGSFGHGSSGG